MKRTGMLCLLLLLGACAPVQWVRPGADAAQLEADSRQCQEQAWREVNWRSSFHYGAFGPMLYHDPFGRRFLAWPHGAFWDAFDDRFMEELRLTNFCMRAKGYELQALPRN